MHVCKRWRRAHACGGIRAARASMGPHACMRCDRHGAYHAHASRRRQPPCLLRRCTSRYQGRPWPMLEGTPPPAIADEGACGTAHFSLACVHMQARLASLTSRATWRRLIDGRAYKLIVGRGVPVMRCSGDSTADDVHDQACCAGVLVCYCAGVRCPVGRMAMECMAREHGRIHTQVHGPLHGRTQSRSLSLAGKLPPAAQSNAPPIMRG